MKKKPELDWIGKMVMRYLKHDESRARRIIKRALPKHNLSRNPVRQKKETACQQE
jgi:hypothetical protein